jgi:Zn-dependent protease with chaperone function
VRLDTANRSFLALVAVAVVPYLVLGTFACGLLSVVAGRVVAGGWSAVAEDDALRPALPLLAIVATGTVLAAWSTLRQLTATRRLGAAVTSTRVPTPTKATDAATSTGVARLDVIDSADAYSFTYGVTKPRVVVSQALVDATTAVELEAVLLHERYHVRNLDTLKVLVARALAAAFFFLPALRHLRSRYLAARELAADRAAVRAGGPKPLAGALYKAVGGPPETLVGAAAALGGVGMLDARLAQLEQAKEPPLTPIPHLVVATTVVGLALTAAAGAVAGAAVGDGGMTMSMDSPGGAMGVIGPLLCAAGWAVVVTGVVRRLATGRG